MINTWILPNMCAQVRPNLSYPFFFFSQIKAYKTTTCYSFMCYSLCVTAYVLQLTCYSLCVTAYVLQLMCYSLCVTAYVLQLMCTYLNKM